MNLAGSLASVHLGSPPAGEGHRAAASRDRGAFRPSLGGREAVQRELWERRAETVACLLWSGTGPHGDITEVLADC